MILPVSIDNASQVPAKQYKKGTNDPEGDRQSIAHPLLAFVHGAYEFFLEGAILLHLIAQGSHVVVTSLPVKDPHAVNGVCNESHAVSIEEVTAVVLIVIRRHHDEAYEGNHLRPHNDRVESSDLTQDA